MCKGGINQNWKQETYLFPKEKIEKKIFVGSNFISENALLCFRFLCLIYMLGMSFGITKQRQFFILSQKNVF